MKISDFTQIELDYFQTLCNFTDEESTLFELRARNAPLEECAERMNRSLDSVKQLSRKVNDKIDRVR